MILENVSQENICPLTNRVLSLSLKFDLLGDQRKKKIIIFFTAHMFWRREWDFIYFGLESSKIKWNIGHTRSRVACFASVNSVVIFNKGKKKIIWKEVAKSTWSNNNTAAS